MGAHLSPMRRRAALSLQEREAQRRIIMDLHAPPSHKTNEQPQQLSFFPLTHFFAFVSGNLPETMPLPCCWDEVRDWCDEITLLTAYLQNHNLYGNDSGPNDGQGGNCMDNNGTLFARYRVLRFVPYILLDCKECEINQLPSMTWMERAMFYSKFVVITVYEQQQSKCDDDRLICLLTLSQFVNMRQLVSRLSEWLLLLQTTQKDCYDALLTTGLSQRTSYNSSKGASKDLKECLICRDANESSVLSCSHSLCRNCEKRWVLKHLACPFCRHSFRNEHDVRASGWELAEWSSADFKKDIVNLKTQLETLWNEVCLKDPSARLEKEPFLACYRELPRRLTMDYEEYGFLVIETTSLS